MTEASGAHGGELIFVVKFAEAVFQVKMVRIDELLVFMETWRFFLSSGLYVLAVGENKTESPGSLSSIGNDIMLVKILVISHPGNAKTCLADILKSFGPLEFCLMEEVQESQTQSLVFVGFFSIVDQEHQDELEKQTPRVDDMNGVEFQNWFRAHVFKLSTQEFVSEELISLAVGPLQQVRIYSTFMVNGYRFHTKDRALRRKTQNSGVLVKGDVSDIDKEYYGVLEDVYELNYVWNRKVYLFKCHWWDVAHFERGYKVDKYGFVSVNTKRSLNTNEPFVLASQAKQVFYLDDISDPGWLVVVKTNPRDLFDVPQEDKEDDGDGDGVAFDQAYQPIEVDQLNLSNHNEVENEITVTLQRVDVEPQTISQESEKARKKARKNMHTSSEVNFIDDSMVDMSVNEESEEEDSIDDNNTDTDSSKD
ncbi:uncharacterized protein G2W53_028823 [Senna tora]|uniref:DUF4216 domain-containing protein n=1 Tax=Senna tora TaxID=362788 RepID=A0A834T307_9FABA|nr:uncharacterized protein G2W53_028823 [Senna tora]